MDRPSRSLDLKAATIALFRPRPVLLLLLLFPGLLLLTESVYFMGMLSESGDLQPADLIVAFEGRPERAREAYRLIDEDYAPYLVVSPASERQLRSLKRKYLPEKPVAVIPEGKARTTLENAVYTRRILQEQDLRSVILVTSWEHMPRSYLLLRLLCLGNGIRIRTHAAATGTIDACNWYRHKLGWKMVYNEMVELWGSLLEYALYQIKGTLPAEAPSNSRFPHPVKRLQLFEVDDRSFHGARLASNPVFVFQLTQCEERPCAPVVKPQLPNKFGVME